MTLKFTNAGVLVAPNAFKGTLSAPTAATCMRDALLQAWPSLNTVMCPIADGGDDTLAVLQQVCHGFQLFQAQVTGPLPGQPVQAAYLYEPARRLAVLEAAQAHGLVKLPSGVLAPMQATSYGVGELIRFVMQQHPGIQTLVVALGGSASTDGGLGALQALGAQLRDQAGNLLSAPVAGENLLTLGEIVLPVWEGAPELLIATDVTNPLLGPQGTAQVFAPQKGATPEQCEALERGLQHMVSLISAIPETASADIPGAGAAGGLGYGLLQWPNSRIVSGFDWLAGLLELPGKIQACDLILTGEGRLDPTSLSGKGVGGVIRLAAGKPVWVVCGDAAPGLSLPDNVRVFNLAQMMGSPQAAMAQPEAALRRGMAAVAEALPSLFEAV